MTVSRITLTPNGPNLSRLVLGLWRLAEWRMDNAHILELVQRCLEVGLTSFDHADIYGGYTCEKIFGDALADQSHLRQQMQIITKCGIKLVHPNRPEHKLKSYDTGRAHIIASVENSLRALRTDYVDVLLIHRPDPLMEADETAEAFGQLKQSGKVLHFGVSNFSPAQFNLLASRLDFPLVTNQIEISVLHLDAFRDGTLEQCQQLRVPPMAWSPLGGGRLFRDNAPQAARVREALKLASPHDSWLSVDQMALKWLLHHPANIVPVLGTHNWERIYAAIQAEALPLTREQWFAIYSASIGGEVP